MNLYPTPKEVVVASENPILILLFKNSSPTMWLVFVLFLSGLLWFLIYFFNWIGVILAIGLWIFYIYPWLWISVANLELRVEQERLTIDKKLFGLSRTCQIDRSNLRFFVQTRKLENQENPRNWDLRLKTDRGKFIYLIAHQSMETSEWLGRLLADIYEVEFKPSYDYG